VAKDSARIVSVRGTLVTNSVISIRESCSRTDSFCVPQLGMNFNAESSNHRLGSVVAFDVLPPRPLPLPVPLPLPLPLPRPLDAGFAVSGSLVSSAATAASSIRLSSPSVVAAASFNPALALSVPACCSFAHKPQVPERFCKISRFGFAQVLPVRVDLTHNARAPVVIVVQWQLGKR
jgi:hypothetical protein